MQIQEALTKVLTTYRANGYTPQSINNGHCHEFATKVASLCSEARIEWGCDVSPALDEIGCHAYVVVNERYYDSEALTGVDSPFVLPFYAKKS